MLKPPYTDLHDDDESQLGCNDMPVVNVVLVLVLVTRRVAEIPVSESKQESQELVSGISAVRHCGQRMEHDMALLHVSRNSQLGELLWWVKPYLQDKLYLAETLGFLPFY